MPGLFLTITAAPTVALLLTNVELTMRNVPFEIIKTAPPYWALLFRNVQSLIVTWLPAYSDIESAPPLFI